jgi:[ribosomal protein S18]-alanine N-acetyltransferase
MLLGVVPEMRRSGIGQLLLRDWRAWGEAGGISEYFLEMRSDNPARHLYLRHGFSECGLRPEYYLGKDGMKRDAVTMRYSGMNRD